MVPVVAGVHAAAPDVVISVDTYRPAVVEAVLDAGAAIVNDVSGLLYPEVAALVAGAGAGLVIMHTRSRPKHKVLTTRCTPRREGSRPTWWASCASGSTRPRRPACPRRRRSSTPGPTSPRPRRRRSRCCGPSTQ